MHKRKKLIKSELMKMFTTTKETLRHYENVGLIQPEIDDKNYRLYGFEDISKLRQLFILKDLGLQLDEMKLVMERTISKEEYETLLEKHYKVLTEKIDRYIEIQRNISVVLNLIKDRSENISFIEKEYQSRTFLMLDTKIILNETPKGYYDTVKNLIHHDYYNERNLVISLNYNTLNNFNIEDSNFCFDISHLDKGIETSKITKEFKQGTYLSVFYVFTHKNSNLSHIKNEIDAYLSKHNLIIEDQNILEFEHPELAMFLDKDEDLYEIQIKVANNN